MNIFVFTQILKNVPFSDDEEDVSYDVESLFTSIPVKETVNYICDEIYVNNRLKHLCKRSILEKLLYKLTTECTFSANNKLYKQTDRVTMGHSLNRVHQLFYEQTGEWYCGYRAAKTVQTVH